MTTEPGRTACDATTESTRPQASEDVEALRDWLRPFTSARDGAVVTISQDALLDKIEAVLALQAKPSGAELEGALDRGAVALDERLKAAGMFTVAEMMGTTPMTRWEVHSGMTDLDTFGRWLDRKVREYLTMRVGYELGDKDKSDELYEWVLAHEGAFSTIRTNFKAALATLANQPATAGSGLTAAAQPAPEGFALVPRAVADALANWTDAEKARHAAVDSLNARVRYLDQERDAGNLRAGNTDTEYAANQRAERALRDATKALSDAALAAAPPLPGESAIQIERTGKNRQGVSVIFAESEYDSEAHLHKEVLPGLIVVLDADGSILHLDIEDLKADMVPPPGGTGQGERVRHVKRGTEYEVVCRNAEVLCDGFPLGDSVIMAGDRVVVFRDRDGAFAVRHEIEFNDGRFIQIPPATTTDGRA